jgi:hypothetical protein
VRESIVESEAANAAAIAAARAGLEPPTAAAATATAEWAEAAKQVGGLARPRGPLATR